MSWNHSEANPSPADTGPTGAEQKPASTVTPDPYRFTCSICGEPSRDICVSCTKDACENHRCLKCLRCSDCCTCEVVRA